MVAITILDIVGSCLYKTQSARSTIDFIVLITGCVYLTVAFTFTCFNPAINNGKTSFLYKMAIVLFGMSLMYYCIACIIFTVETFMAQATFNSFIWVNVINGFMAVIIMTYALCMGFVICCNFVIDKINAYRQKKQAILVFATLQRKLQCVIINHYNITTRDLEEFDISGANTIPSEHASFTDV